MAGGCSVSTDFVHSEAAGLCHTEPTHTLVTALPGIGNSPRLCQGVSEGAHTLNPCLISNHSLLSFLSAKQRHCQTFNHIKKSFNKLGSSQPFNLFFWPTLMVFQEFLSVKSLSSDSFIGP